MPTNIVPSGGAKAVIHELNYQGYLASATDTVGITGTPNIIFRLYTTPTGGISIWGESHIAVPVNKGIFNVILGSMSPIPSTIFTGDPLWLETQVVSDTLTPRKKLVSVGYAIKAEMADIATTADTANYVAGANVVGEVSFANRADTASYATTANVQYVDSARVAVNAWNWNNNAWGTKYPSAVKADTAYISDRYWHLVWS
ncbi:MAG: hypothetical protein HY769_08495 [Candidatus Stahlbacteria bacterium]|nr:hypothetical protein [Candidatus Stahlbacteria bacterium]